MSILKKKPKAKKCNELRTISLNAHTSKTLAKVLQRRNEMKNEDVKCADDAVLLAKEKTVLKGKYFIYLNI
jgi:hypothetical protein